MTATHQSPAIVHHLAQLVTCLIEAAALAERILADISQEPETTASQRDCQPATPGVPPNAENGRPPIADRATFSVRWAGKTCYLGNTLPFRLIERLARRPNHRIPCEVLMDDVWEGCRSKEAIRSVVKILRQKLIAAGMADLARAIDGRTAGHYGLMLSESL